jgi:hypothetical protein
MTFSQIAYTMTISQTYNNIIEKFSWDREIDFQIERRLKL